MTILLGAGVLISAGAVGVLGALATRRSTRLATILCGIMLALVLVKVGMGRVPAAEPRFFPWDWYPWVETWWYLYPGFFLLGAGLFLGRRSMWKRDTILVIFGLLACRAVTESSGMFADHSELRGKLNQYGVCRQTSNYSCAAAACVSFLHHYDVAATEQEMAGLCATRASGTSDAGIMRGLRRKLDGRARVMIVAPRYEDIPVPSLVPIRLTAWIGHCVVVERLDADGVVLNDPLTGLRHATRAEFEDRWQGSAIYVERH